MLFVTIDRLTMFRDRYNDSSQELGQNDTTAQHAGIARPKRRRMFDARQVLCDIECKILLLKDSMLTTEQFLSAGQEMQAKIRSVSDTYRDLASQHCLNEGTVLPQV